MTTTKNRYDISVIIPTYNRSRLLAYTLTSLLKQDLAKNRFEVIVTDDGSTDDTREMVREFEPLMNVKYTFQENKGYRPGLARNRGIRIAEGEVCLFIDSSVILNVNCLSRHIAFYTETPGKIAAIGYVYGFDRTPESEVMLKDIVSLEDLPGSIEKLAAQSIFSDVRDDIYLKYNYQIHNLPATWIYFWTCHVSARRSDLLNVGMFDKLYDGKWGVEDNELGFRLMQAGIKIHLIRDAEAIHYPHPKDREERIEEGVENCTAFHNKYQLFETGLFLAYYRSPVLVDINHFIAQGNSQRLSYYEAGGLLNNMSKQSAKPK
jgi:glycosyltransferase involved in cell wall biosynthesis